MMGRVLRELRLERGLSLEETAARSGVARQTVRYVEAATHSVRMDVVWRIAAGLGMPCSALLALAEARLAREGQG